ISVTLDDRCEVPSPPVRQAHLHKSWQIEPEQFHSVSAGKTAARLVDHFILDNARECCSAPKKDGLVKNSPYKTGDVVTVVPSHLPVRIAQTLRKLRGSRKQQQPSRFDGVARHADQAGLLSLLFALIISIHDGVDPAGGTMFDFCGRGLASQVEVSGCFRPWDFRVQRAPFRGHLAALHAEALLNTGAASVKGS